VFSVVRAARFAMQRCGKHISAGVNQHATIEEAVFSVGAGPSLYDEDFMQLEGQLRIEFRSRQLQKRMRESAVEGIEKKWQERN
jgi:hypothetical protein